MSGAVAFDTLKFVEKLEAGGFTHAQAKATAEAFAEATGQELATKADIAAVRTDLRTEIAAVRAELRTEFAAVRAELRTEIAAVRAELRETELRLEAKIEGVKSDIVKWMFGTIGFQTLIIIGAVVALARMARP
ncbi:MAG TPA: DUF1640 domain-containing protein [Methylocystis sp.]|nr:DUF1640 domain-containing protein [Methylocystis sp.]